MKKIVLFVVFLFALTCPKTFAQAVAPTAQTAAPTPGATSQASNSESVEFTTDPPQVPQEEGSKNFINDLTPSVKVTFTGLENQNSFVCLRNDLCIDDYFILAEITKGGSQKANDLLTSVGIDKKKLDEGKEGLKKYKLSNGEITVCGDGDSALKANKDCDPKHHYFHAGKYYLLTVYREVGNKYIADGRAGFFVSHTTPKVEITASPNFTSGAKLTVAITQSELALGGKNRNNYQVVVEGPAYKKEECDYVEKENVPRTFEFPLSKKSHSVDKDPANLIQSGLPAGRYLIKINEQNHESNKKLRSDNCQGGFTYMHQYCTLSKSPGVGKCEDPIPDPNKDDAKDFLSFMRALNNNQGLIPCKANTAGVTSPLDCPEIDTAIGPIKVDLTGFISRLFSIVLSIAGVAALSLIIFSGYKLLISRGNKEAIQGARETLTAAIVGLLFIVFSLVILSVIGGDILKIPGFG